MSEPRTSTPSTHSVELTIGGMTCASCAARIERKLHRLPGVEASVNFATEKARVVLPEDVTVEDAIATVEATGYTATRLDLPRNDVPEEQVRARGDDAEVASLRQRLLV